METGALRREPRSSSGVVGAPLEDEDEEGGCSSELLRRFTTGSTGLLFREMERKKRVWGFAGSFLWACGAEWLSGAEDAAVEEAASDLSERLEAKTAAIRRMGGTYEGKTRSGCVDGEDQTSRGLGGIGGREKRRGEGRRGGERRAGEGEEDEGKERGIGRGGGPERLAGGGI